MQAQAEQGKLTIQDYIAGVQKAVEFDKRLVLALKQRGKKREAGRVFGRLKIMSAELVNAKEGGLIE